MEWYLANMKYVCTQSTLGYCRSPSPPEKAWVIQRLGPALMIPRPRLTRAFWSLLALSVPPPLPSARSWFGGV
jgi:hypothetical protein